MISFKRLKFNDNQSRGSMAYTGDVYWKNNLMGHIRNDGGGGMSVLHASSTQAHKHIDEALAYAKTQRTSLSGIEPSLYQYLEDFIDDCAVKDGAVVQITRWLRRSVKDRIAFIVGTERYTSMKATGTLTLEVLRQLVKEKYPGAIILNDLPEADAIGRVVAMEIGS